MKKFMKEVRGSILVEAAFVLPVMLTIILVGLGLSIVAIQKSELSRAVTVGSIYLAAPHTDADPCQTAATRMQDASPMLDPTLLTISVSLTGGSGSSCPGVKSGSGQSLTINAIYPCNVPYFRTCSISDSSTVTE